MNTETNNAVQVSDGNTVKPSQLEGEVSSDRVETSPKHLHKSAATVEQEEHKLWLACIENIVKQ